MVLPDGTGRETGRPQPGRKLLVVLAVTVVGIGALLMGSLTGPEPTAIEEPPPVTTTTLEPMSPPVDLDAFTLDQLEVGEQLEWSRVAEVPGAVPQSLIAHRDWVYVFSPVTGEGTGIKAWRSTDGTRWESLGTVISERHQISSVAATSLGLIAIEPDASDAYVHIWGSVDGTRWLEIVDGIPVARNQEEAEFHPSAIAADERILAVAGRVEPDVSELAERYLSEQAGTRVDLAGLRLGWSESPEDLYMTIYGPLGFPAARISASDLDLTEEQREEVSGYFMGRPGSTTIWTKADDGAWQVGEVEGASFINALAPDEDGGLRAYGTGYLPGSWLSHNGVDWEQVDDSSTPSRVEAWGDRLVGIGTSGDALDVVLSRDGETWTESGLAGRFPEEIIWYPLGFATGPGGIATVFDAQVDERPRGVPEVSTLTIGESTITVDLLRGVVHLAIDQRLYTWPIGSEGIEGVEPDLANRTLSFTDPTSGEELARFTFDQLIELASRAYVAVDPEESETGLAFSPDGSEWIVQNITTEIGRDAAVSHVEVAGDQVLALVERLPEWDRPYGLEGFEIWSAPIP